MQREVTPGRVIAVLGPDGSGKSTFADALVQQALADRPVLRLHHRPGAFASKSGSGMPTTDPHGAAGYPRWLATVKVVFLFLDFKLGWWSKIRPFLRKGGWVVWERPWWDIEIDPARYRLRGSRLARVLGKALPAPDLVIILEAPVEVLLDRKQEVSEAELVRQTAALRRIVPRGVRTLFLDSRHSVPALVDETARELALPGTGSEVASRWAALPRASSRWILPTAPRRAAATGLRIFQPVTLKGLAGWQTARLAATFGGLRFLPGGASVPPDIEELLAANGVGWQTLAVARANHPSRFLALVLDDSYRIAGVAKMAFDDAGRAALDREARAIETATRIMTGRVRPPEVSLLAEGLLLLEPVEWSPRFAPWRLPGEVAYEVGNYSRTLSDGSGNAAHGDFAPWNLLRTKQGWVLLDWEHSSAGRPPFFDLWHYLLQAHSLLGRPSSRTLLDAVRGKRNWVHMAVAEYARGCERDAGEAVLFLDDYIRASSDQLSGQSEKEREALGTRLRLQAEINASKPT